MSNLTYTIAKANLNTVDWEGATKFRVLLADASYTPDASHEFVSDVAADEATGVGYARKLLATKTRAVSGDDVNYRAAASSWTLLTSDFRWAIVYCDVDGSDGDDESAWLVCAIDLGAQSIVAALYTLNYGGASPGAVFQVQ